MRFHLGIGIVYCAINSMHSPVTHKDALICLFQSRIPHPFCLIKDCLALYP